MPMQALRLRAFAFVACLAMLAFSGWAGADPPSRVARLGYLSGAVSFSPAGENDWDEANINRPLTTGDRLWSDAGARAEIQVGGAMIRMRGETSVSVLNLDDRIIQLQLTQGTLNVRVRRLDPGQVFEVDTPNLAFTLRQPGEYRIEVDPEGDATTIFVRKGRGEAYGDDAAYVIDAGQGYRFTGTGLREYDYVDAPRLDEFDRWAVDRDRRYDNSASARYVSRDVVGYQDLDAYGNWREDATYGNVWIPSRVAADWAPYRDGHWAWVDPWGWTWVDDAPWGFAVSHYGRWTHIRETWAWVPGPVRSRSYYAPALVVFVGGGTVGGVGWFPLGPREVYRPAYPVSRRYFENINRSNTVINNTVINTYYNNSNVTNVVYANRRVPGALVALPTTAFAQSQPVSRAAVRASRDMMVGAPVAVVPAVAPTEKSVRGAAGHGNKPPGHVFERRVFARSTPPAAHAGFAAQEEQLRARPGKPLDAAARQALKPAAAAPAPAVKVIAKTQVAPPTVRPPPAATGARPGDDARGKSGERKIRVAPGTPVTPEAPAQRAAPGQPTQPTQPTPPVPAAQGMEQRGRSEQFDKAERRARPEAPPPPPQRAVEPRATPTQAVPAAPRAQPPDLRGRSEQRDNGDQRRRPEASPPPPAAPKRAIEPPAAPPQAASPAPRAQQPDQRGRSEQRDNFEQRRQTMPPPSPRPERVVEPRAAPPQVAPRAPPPPEPKAEPRGQEPRPAAGKPNDRKMDRDEREQESRRPER